MRDVAPQKQEQFRVLLRLTRDWFETRRAQRRLPLADRDLVRHTGQGRELEPGEVSSYGADPPWI